MSSEYKTINKINLYNSKIEHKYTVNQDGLTVTTEDYLLSSLVLNPKPKLLKILSTFLNVAHTIASLSKDETKHGCVILDDKYRILGTGYNGFPSGFLDNKLPHCREPVKDGPFQGLSKYNFTIHAELNAILNCTHRPENGLAIVTGLCCSKCLLHLHQVGIHSVFQQKRMSNMLDDIEMRTRNHIISMTHMNIYEIEVL